MPRNKGKSTQFKENSSYIYRHRSCTTKAQQRTISQYPQGLYPQGLYLKTIPLFSPHLGLAFWQLEVTSGSTVCYDCCLSFQELQQKHYYWRECSQGKFDLKRINKEPAELRRKR